MRCAFLLSTFSINFLLDFFLGFETKTEVLQKVEFGKRWHYLKNISTFEFGLKGSIGEQSNRSTLDRT
jgi:hypothetical protein